MCIFILVYCSQAVAEALEALSAAEIRPIAIRLQFYCAIYDAPPTHLLYGIHHTISVMAISCKRQSSTRLILCFCLKAVAEALEALSAAEIRVATAQQRSHTAIHIYVYI